MTNTDPVLLTVQNGIAMVTLNRPDKHNGFDMAMIEALTDTAKRIRRDRRIRCVILHGAGPSFSAGLDFKAVTTRKSAFPKLFFKWPWTKANLAQRVNLCWRELPVPVIAAIHGPCFGAALQLVLAADYRIAAPDARLSIMEIKWGLIPDMSATVTLSRLVALDAAQEMTWTGRQVAADEARSLGLVSRVVDDPLAEAGTLAGTIAAQSPDAIAASKILYNKTWHAGIRRALLWERWLQARILFRKNNRIALKNGFREAADRQPFEDRHFFR